MEHICLNCSEISSKRFCPNCGQKTDTHRITFRNFIAHDLLHGTFHLERGILFTLREAFLRPGQAALDYISGKRVRYYNVFYLCLIMVGLIALLMHFNGVARKQTQSMTELLEFLKHHVKFIVLGIVPIFALNAKLVFRKLKLNFAEHFIVSGMGLLGILLFVLVWQCLNTLVRLDWVAVVFRLFILFFPAWTYYNAVRKLYKFPGYFWRMAVFYLLLFIEILLFFGLTIFFVTSESNLIINS